MTYKGKIKTGFGNASFWVSKINEIFEKRYGMKLFLGTLNIELEKEYILKNSDKILASEYGGDYNVFIQKCEILGNNAYIVRTEKNNTKFGAHPLNIIEIVSDINIRERYKLEDNDEIEIII